MWFRNILNALRPGSRPRSRWLPPAPLLRPTVEVLEDRTVPAFLTAVSYPVGSVPLAVAVANLDGNSTLDLVVANNSDSTISVLLGNSDGTFQTAQTYSTGSSPLSIAVGDIDGDLIDDVVTANVSDLSVLRNNGDGTFQDAQSVSLGTNPLSVAVGDFNDDGNMDLGVTSNLYHGPYPYQGYYGYYYSGFYTGHANVLLGNGAGEFTIQNSSSLGGGFPNAATVGDLDGDGNLDLVTANSDAYSVSVLLGDGAGGFSSGYDLGTGSYPLSVTVGDLDGDSDLDLVTANYYGNNVSVRLNDGAGGFGSAQSYNAGSNPYSVALGDFNDDGVPDLVTANISGDDVSVLIGKGDGSFNIPLNSDAGTSPNSVAVWDFDGDGLDDVAVAGGGSSAGAVSVLLNAGNFPSANGPYVTVGDVTISEGNTGTKQASFVVTLSSNPTETVEVSYSTANGTATTADGDYESKSGTLTFTPGGPLTQMITVTMNGDRRGELNETFLVNLGSVPNAYVTDAQGVATVTDDEPRLTITDASISEGSRGTRVLTFTVTLSFAYDAPITVSYGTGDGSAKVSDNDYVARSGTLTFNPGAPLTQTISIVVNGDQRKEPNESLFVNLSNANGALILDAVGVGTILNDDNGNHGKKNR